jgi:16S rRNA (cytidine1402-2'-O)-methyltransferase
MAGKLFIVATPIGNLEDITLRALRVLKEVDFIAAEDTRHTAILLKHYEIHKPLISYHQFNEAKRASTFLEQLSQGKNIALVSDAGFPGISDPGERLIATCLNHQIEVEVIPGASAVLHALAASGFAMCPFSFRGFLPVKGAQRMRVIASLKEVTETTVFFESPYRIAKTLEAIAEQFPERRVCVARELTKKFEEVLRGTAQELAQDHKGRKWRGEISLVIEGVSHK